MCVKTYCHMQVLSTTKHRIIMYDWSLRLGTWNWNSVCSIQVPIFHPCITSVTACHGYHHHSFPSPTHPIARMFSFCFNLRVLISDVKIQVPCHLCPQVDVEAKMLDMNWIRWVRVFGEVLASSPKDAAVSVSFYNVNLEMMRRTPSNLNTDRW